MVGGKENEKWKYLVVTSVEVCAMYKNLPLSASLCTAVQMGFRFHLPVEDFFLFELMSWVRKFWLD
jgi:hypothetical protein